MNNSAEVLPVAYEIQENTNINNATFATVYINYEPDIEQLEVIETNQRHNGQIFDKKYKIIFIFRILQVTIIIGIFIFLLVFLFNHYD